jgi:hypothetical protein
MRVILTFFFTMALLSDLPTELLLIIFSGLMFQTNLPHGYMREENQQAILPLAGTNKRLWKVARPFLYRAVGLFFKPCNKISGSSKKVISWKLASTTSLLCRTLRENPSITAYVQLVEIQGLLAPVWEGDLNRRDSASLTQDNAVSYSAKDMASLLSLFNSTQSLLICGVLKGNIQHDTNEIIMTCLRAMSSLNLLWLSVNRDAGNSKDDIEGSYLSNDYTPIGTLCSILTNTSSTLKNLRFAQRTLNPTSNHADFSNYKGLIVDDNFQLEVLSFPADIAPFIAFKPWVHTLRSLVLHDLKFSEGKTNQGFGLQKLLMPTSATLQHLELIVCPYYDQPSLNDLDMSQMIALKSLEYEGPWWINPTVDPNELFKSFFSRTYDKLELNIESYQQSHRVTHESVLALREAFEMAFVEHRAPLELKLELDIQSFDLYEYDETLHIQKDIRRLMRDARKHGVKVKWHVQDQEDALNQ